MQKLLFFVAVLSLFTCNLTANTKAEDVEEQSFVSLASGDVIDITGEGLFVLKKLGTLGFEDEVGFHVWGKTGLQFYFEPYVDSKWHDYRFIQIITEVHTPVRPVNQHYLARLPFVDPPFEVLVDGVVTPYDHSYVDERIFYWTDRTKKNDYMKNNQHVYFDAPDWHVFHAETFLVKSSKKPQLDKNTKIETETLELVAAIQWGYDDRYKKNYFRLNAIEPKSTINLDKAVKQFERQVYKKRKKALAEELATIPEPFKDYFIRNNPIYRYKIQLLD